MKKKLTVKFKSYQSCKKFLFVLGGYYPFFEKWNKNSPRASRKGKSSCWELNFPWNFIHFNLFSAQHLLVWLILLFFDSGSSVSFLGLKVFWESCRNKNIFGVALFINHCNNSSKGGCFSFLLWRENFYAFGIFQDFFHVKPPECLLLESRNLELTFRKKINSNHKKTLIEIFQAPIEISSFLFLCFLYFMDLVNSCLVFIFVAKRPQ